MAMGWKKVKDSRNNFYRRLFRDIGIYTNYFDNKVVGYFGPNLCDLKTVRESGYINTFHKAYN